MPRWRNHRIRGRPRHGDAPLPRAPEGQPDEHQPGGQNLRRGLAHRARLDDSPEVADFAENLEKACISTIEGGTFTKDLAVAIHGTTSPPDGSYVYTDDFLDALEARQKELLG